MKRLALIVALISVAVLAGELPIGVLTPRGVSTNNLGGGADAGFLMGSSQKITVQCRNPDGGTNNGVYICVNATTCTANAGVFITGNQALPTSSAQNRVLLVDGGSSALISAFAGTDWGDCPVFTRAGNEF